ncbi:hypothetical protein FACS189481_3820 [Clostridia bacterium]|nr:hypothetical protein FACS189481_3820 [Clostridia bacterium]
MLSDAELKKSFDSKYVKIRTFVVPYNVAKGTEEETEKSDAKADTEEEKKRKEEAAAKEAKEEAKKRAESYIKDIEKLGFAKVAAKEEARLQAASGQKSESKETEEEKIKRLSQAQVISKERFVGMESFLKAIEGASLNKAVLYDAAEGHEFYVFEVVEKTDEEFKKEKENLIQVLKKDEFDANLLKYGKEEVKVKFNDSALAKQSPRDIEFGFGGF